MSFYSTRINWQSGSTGGTPESAANFNKMDAAIKLLADMVGNSTDLPTALGSSGQALKVKAGGGGLDYGAVSGVTSLPSLTDVSTAVTAADGNFLVGNSSKFVGESGATARTSLGLGSLATQNSVNNADWSGTDLAVTNGGTGASDASGARSNLGAQAQGDVLDDLNTLGAATADDQFIVATGAGAFAYESGATARASLSLGTLATLNTVNDGNWSGTDLAVANGGTGASNASGARSNLGLGSQAVENQTISTSAPSGGADGDVWYRVST